MKSSSEFASWSGQVGDESAAERSWPAMGNTITCKCEFYTWYVQCSFRGERVYSSFLLRTLVQSSFKVDLLISARFAACSCTNMYAYVPTQTHHRPKRSLTDAHLQVDSAQHMDAQQHDADRRFPRGCVRRGSLRGLDEGCGRTLCVGSVSESSSTPTHAHQ